MTDHTGNALFPTIHHDTYPAIDPAKADLSGKIVLVSGASRGLGKVIAASFAQAGVAGLVLLARGDTTAVETACKAVQRPGQALKLLSLHLDVTDPEKTDEAAKQVKETFGRLDIVVNNAGYLEAYNPLAESDPYDWWKTWEVNIRGVYNITRSFIPLLLEGGDKTIVNVSSIVAHMLIPNLSSYPATKFALLRLTESTVLDYGSKGLLAYSVHPCATPTDLNANDPPWIQKLLIDTPEIAAHNIVWLVRERREWLAGRYVSCLWDVDELLAKKQEIVEGDKLKMKMVV